MEKNNCSSEKNKVFILDTNVILHDSACLNKFKNNEVIIPITVIEELDKFKKGNGTINANAREFIRSLDKLSGDKIFNGGVANEDGEGCIRVRLMEEIDEKIRNNFINISSDACILNTAYLAAKNRNFKNVTFITKDGNLRLRARSLGVLTENYDDHSVPLDNIEKLYTGKRVIHDIESDVIDELYKNFDGVDVSRFNENDFFSNEHLVLKNGSKSALAFFDSCNQKIKGIKGRVCMGVTPKNLEQTFALSTMINPDIPLVTITGKAGTGKTLLALAAALETKKFYRQIFISRPTVPLSNKDIGYLPGDIASKLDPYMQPLYDNLSVIQSQFSGSNGRSKQIKQLFEEEKIVITPLSYIRGRSIVKVFFIIDEAQNLTPHEVKTIVTRVGEGTKLVFTGDIHQIDHPYLDSKTNGLTYVIEKMKGQPLYAHINLEKGERSPLSELASKIL